MMPRCLIAVTLLFSGVCAWQPTMMFPRSAVRHAPPQCNDVGLPPEKAASLQADAWQRDEKVCCLLEFVRVMTCANGACFADFEQAQELAEVLQGCSLYLVGLGPKKSSVGRVLARRLARYRCYDIPSLMCSTYKALSGGAEELSLAQLVASEPIADVEQLATAVLREVQPFTRSVFVAWDGAVSVADFAVMQQGIIVHLESASEEGVVLPSEDAETAVEAWREGHRKADTTVQLEDGLAADDAAKKVVDALLAFIAANPAKSSEWKAEADAKLAAKESE